MSVVEHAMERFLVEDVLLTLGNMRMALAWAIEGMDLADNDARRAGLDRIDSQIGMLLDRARAISSGMPPLVTGTPDAPLPAKDEPHLSSAVAPPNHGPGASGLARLLRDALGDDAPPTEAHFRSVRWSGGRGT